VQVDEQLNMNPKYEHLFNANDWSYHDVPIDLSYPPHLTPDRRRQLDSGQLPDYDSYDDDEHKELMRQRGIGIRGRNKREHRINSLVWAHDDDSEAYQYWKTVIDFQTKLQERRYLEVENHYLDDAKRNAMQSKHCSGIGMSSCSAARSR
jgi:hypothetical protein